MHDTNDNPRLDDLTKLEAELKETIEERDDVYDANNRLSDAYDELEQKVRELEGAKSASESFVEDKAELGELRELRQSLESKLEQQSGELNLLQSELQTFSDMKENNSDLRMKVESLTVETNAIDSLRRELTEAKSSIEDLRNSNQTLESSVADQHSLITELKAKEAELRSRNDSDHRKLIDLGEVQQANSLLSNQIRTLQSETRDLESEKARVEKLTGECQRLHGSHQALTEQNETLSTQVAALSEVQRQLAGSIDQVSELQRENAGLKTSLDNSRQKLTAFESSNLQLQQEAQKLKSVAEVESKAQGRLRVLEMDLRTVSESRDCSANELAKLQANFQVQQVRFDTEKAALAAQLEAKQESQQEQQNLSAELKASRDQLIIELESSQQRIADIESQLEIAQKQAYEQARHLKSADEDRAKLADQLAEINDEQRMLRQSVIRDSARLVQQEKQIKRLEGLENSLRKSLEQEKTAISSKENELTETKKAVRTLRAKARQQSKQLMLDLGGEPKGDRKTNAAAAALSKTSGKKASPKRAPSKQTAKKSQTKPPAKDDLSRIEGIGPKIKSVLADKGIKTFKKLATTKVTRLEKVLSEAGPNFSGHDPATWPEQAGLAAEERWDALDRLQKKLLGGRQS